MTKAPRKQRSRAYNHQEKPHPTTQQQKKQERASKGREERKKNAKKTKKKTDPEPREMVEAMREQELRACNQQEKPHPATQQQKTQGQRASKTEG